MCFTTQSWGLPDCKNEYHNCYGTFIWKKSGDKYQGEWKNRKRHGIGTYEYANGDKYIGEFVNHMMSGKGTMYYLANNEFKGFTYSGMFLNSKRHGYGIFKYPDGSKHAGLYKNDLKNGDGIYTHANGEKYKGEFKNGKMSGAGIYVFPNSTKYIGQFENNKYNGKGILIQSNGKVEEGIFKDNKFMYAQKIKKIKKNYAELSKPSTTSKELDALKLKAENEERKRKELEKRLAVLESKPKTIIKTEPKSEFSNQPININFKSITKRPDDIAVIIGNANYEKMGKDIPNVNPAYADAEGIKQYFMQAKGVKEGNVIYLKDATAAQLLTVFGNQNTHKGQLYNWVKPNVSNVYVYYAGHGVPGGDKGNAYLVPTDANAQSIGLSGYPLETLYSNLGKLSAKSITVILEACFSGASQAGNLFSKSSPIVIRAKKTMIPKNVKVISAGAVDQMASWEQDNSHGLFTKYFLKAMSGEGDKNNDGKVSDTELKNYLGETMTYYARRYYGRDQNVQIMQGN